MPRIEDRSGMIPSAEEVMGFYQNAMNTAVAQGQANTRLQHAKRMDDLQFGRALMNDAFDRTAFNKRQDMAERQQDFRESTTEQELDLSHRREQRYDRQEVADTKQRDISNEQNQQRIDLSSRNTDLSEKRFASGEAQAVARLVQENRERQEMAQVNTMLVQSFEQATGDNFDWLRGAAPMVTPNQMSTMLRQLNDARQSNDPEYSTQLKRFEFEDEQIREQMVALEQQALEAQQMGDNETLQTIRRQQATLRARQMENDLKRSLARRRTDPEYVEEAGKAEEAMKLAELRSMQEAMFNFPPKVPTPESKIAAFAQVLDEMGWKSVELEQLYAQQTEQQQQ